MMGSFLLFPPGEFVGFDEEKFGKGIEVLKNVI
jgi:hypothetical protein